MSTNLIERVNNYRRRTRRCRTCWFAAPDYLVNGYHYTWICKCKNKRHSGNLYDTTFAGMFCKQYTPEE